MSDVWKVCSSCRNPITFRQTYWACSVSTCAKGKHALYFCSVSCWDAHLSGVRHRESWAVELKAPSHAEPDPLPSAPASAPSSPSASAPLGTAPDDDVLIVVSKLKNYIRARSGFNTSDNVTKILSDHVRALADDAIRTAGTDGRRTVMDRDFSPVRRR